MHNETTIHHDARGEVMEPAISPRAIRMGRPPQRWFHHIVLLTAGTMTLARGETLLPVHGPALVFLPPSEGESAAIAAGAQGYLIGVSQEIIGEAIGDHAESPSLRLFSSGLSITDDLDNTHRNEIEPLFQGFISELFEEGRASRMVASAYARLILMAAWRLFGADERSAAAASGTGPILQRFRQLVEANFRKHWSIGDYASELGISTDRLHAICRRTLSHPPVELVHDRLVQEAKLRLERGARSVQDISDSLGFRDPANFSHFFKRKTGVSPAKYRALAASATGAASIPMSSGYYEWP
ncbi:MAG: AraC family transcriptional regulator [Rhizobium sp.]|nr:AraC family transcriptional regulator [Rhizobium sp.]